MTNHYTLNGSFEQRRESALEKITNNFKSRGFRVQRIGQEEGPCLAVKLPSVVNPEFADKNGCGGRLELSNESDGLTCLRVTQGYALAYGLKPTLDGPNLAAGGIYVAWISFSDKEN